MKKTTDQVSKECNAVVVKTAKNGRMMKIVCWMCSKTQWVQRGSHCYNEGVCGRCINQIGS
jgi:hypothetical protein